MQFKAAGFIGKIWDAGQSVATAAIRLQNLVAFGVYLLLWSKIFKGHSLLVPLEEALLATKSVRRLPPGLDVTDGIDPIESWTSGFAGANAALFLNLHNPDRLSPTRYARAAPSFRAIYLWDSAFIAKIWKIWDPDVAWEILNSVISVRRGDRLPHYASDLADSKFTQPPLVTWSFQQLQRQVAPERFQRWASILYDPLRAYHQWLYAHRQLPNGLFAWAHPYESGVENAPRFGSRDERTLIDTRMLGAPDFCTYVVLQCEALARLARTLGRPEDATEHDLQADRLARARLSIVRMRIEDLTIHAPALTFSAIRFVPGGQSRATASILSISAPQSATKQPSAYAGRSKSGSFAVGSTSRSMTWRGCSIR